MKTILFFLSLSIFQPLTAQEFSLITPLDDAVVESSGLISIDHKLFTHNDSGNEPVLYEIDTLLGTIKRTVTIENAQNTDWEDIASDDNYIFIGDFGNNSGSRTDLKIYRVSRTDFFATENDDMVSAESINFSFEDQTNFTSNPFQTDFDCEAVISYGDSLYVFTKDWVDKKSRIYSLPKIPGTYSAQKVDSIDPEGLITGATYNAATHKILLTGYTNISPFFVEIDGFQSVPFSARTVEKHSLEIPGGYSFQIEGITEKNTQQYYVSSEGGVFGNSGLYLLKPEDDLGTNEKILPEFRLFPNPAKTVVYIQCENFASASIFSMDGKLKKRTTQRTIHVSGFQKGIYLVRVKNLFGRTTIKKLLIN